MKALCRSWGLLEWPAEDELHVADRACPEQRLAGGEVEVPDPDEAVVEAERANLGEALEEPLAPGLQSVRVMRPDLVEPDHHQAGGAAHRRLQRLERRQQGAGKDVPLDPVL